MGIGLAGLCRNADVAAAAGMAISLPMQFLCGTFFPIEEMPSLLRHIAHALPLTRLAVRDYENARIRVLDVSEVDWIGVEGEQVMVHVGDRAYPVRRTLTELEARLDPADFFRAHRSAIVNLDRVKEVIPWFKGSHKLRLTTGAEVELSRAQGRALRRILEW